MSMYLVAEFRVTRMVIQVQGNALSPVLVIQGTAENMLANLRVEDCGGILDCLRMVRVGTEWRAKGYCTFLVWSNENGGTSAKLNMMLRELVEGMTMHRDGSYKRSAAEIGAVDRDGEAVEPIRITVTANDAKDKVKEVWSALAGWPMAGFQLRGNFSYSEMWKGVEHLYGVKREE